MKSICQYKLEMMLLVIVMFCCVASDANAQCFGMGTAASSPGVGSCLETPNPTARFTVPNYPWFITEITTYHGWTGPGAQPAGYMTITDDAGNIYYQGASRYIDETPGGTTSGWWLGRLVTNPKIYLPAGDYILAVDAWQTWQRPASAGGCSGNSYLVYGMPCPGSLTREQCIACGNSMT